MLIVVACAAVFALLGATSAEGQGTAAYVVEFKDGTDASAKTLELEKSLGFRADHRYSASVLGFAAKLATRQRDAVSRDPQVALVHADKPVRLALPARSAKALSLATGVKRIGGGTKAAAGVAVAVLDTGVDLTHPDLVALAGTNCVGGANRRPTAVSDGQGHGTHVSGTIGGRGGIGVAPGTTLYAVKVLDDQGRGSTSQLICGIDWVTANAARLGIRVASLSLGMPGAADGDCGRSSRDVLHKAICRSVDGGVVYVVAAGNDATDIAGAAHLIAAPGVCIRSSWPGGGYRTISGTSMAAPHVAATVALCIASGRCRGAPAAIIRQVRADAAAHGDHFTGDERSLVAGRHFGELAWAGSY